MTKYRVHVETIVDVDTDEMPDWLRDSLASEYQPTPEEPDPDEEWLAEEWALTQVTVFQGAATTDITTTVTEVEEWRSLLTIQDDDIQDTVNHHVTEGMTHDETN